MDKNFLTIRKGDLKIEEIYIFTVQNNITGKKFIPESFQNKSASILPEYSACVIIISLYEWYH